jgi:hypothetical protein
MCEHQIFIQGKEILNLKSPITPALDTNCQSNKNEHFYVHETIITKKLPLCVCVFVEIFNKFSRTSEMCEILVKIIPSTR